MTKEQFDRASEINDQISKIEKEIYHHEKIAERLCERVTEVEIKFTYYFDDGLGKIETATLKGEENIHSLVRLYIGIMGKLEERKENLQKTFETL